jgi:hypothetical protein
MYFTYQKYYLNATQGVLKCMRPIQKVKFRYFIFWEVCNFLLVDFTPHNSTINSVAYHETLEMDCSRLFGKMVQHLDQRNSFSKCSTSQWCRNLHLLKSCGWNVLPHQPCSSDLHCRTSICSHRRKCASNVNTCTTAKTLKMKSGNDDGPRTHCFNGRN